MMPRDFEYTEVTDNTLLPFGANILAPGDYGATGPIDITPIFEDGFSFGSEVFESLWIATDGGISFDTPDSWPNPSYTYSRFNIAPFLTDLHTAGSTLANTGVFWDLNTDRDSVVITWNEVGLWYQDYDVPVTFQLEILDLGDGDAEVIFRYVQTTDRYGYSAGIVADPGTGISYNGYDTGIPGELLDETEGNTGVTGVWQFRIVDGVLEPGVEALGTSEADDMLGSLRDDTLNGLDGDDTIDGDLGNDLIEGANGNDLINGGGGHDTITGGADADTINGGTDNDQISGQAGNDVIDGGAGHDLMFGGEGNDVIAEGWLTEGTYWLNDDTIIGGAGEDSIQGAYGRDSIEGEDGDDFIQGGEDRDTIDGGNGNDVIAGGGGNDTLLGGAGDDFIFGDWGVNTATGGEGADTFLLTPDGTLIITDYTPDEGDRLIVDGDIYDRSDFYARAGGEGDLYGPDGKRVVTDVEILHRDEDGNFNVIAEIALNGDVDELVLRLPTVEEGPIDPIVWDFF